MEFSASGPAAIPIFLLGMAIPLIIFVVIPILIIRSIIRAIKSNLPSGFSLDAMRQMATQFPKGTNWQAFAAEWDIQIDPQTKKITLKRKVGLNQASSSSVPQEIQIDSFAQLPETLKRIMPAQQDSYGNVSGQEMEFGSSDIKPQPHPEPAFQNRISGGGESKELAKKLALALLAVGIFYGLKVFLT